jgi:hypothetical protein
VHFCSHTRYDSVMNGSQQASAGMIFLVAYVVRHHMTTLAQSFLVLAACSGLSVVLCLISIPTQREYFDKGELAVGVRR